MVSEIDALNEKLERKEQEIESLSDYNDFQHSNVVSPKEFKGAKLDKKGALSVKVPTKSIVVLNIK